MIDGRRRRRFRRILLIIFFPGLGTTDHASSDDAAEEHQQEDHSERLSGIVTEGVNKGAGGIVSQATGGHLDLASSALLAAQSRRTVDHAPSANRSVALSTSKICGFLWVPKTVNLLPVVGRPFLCHLGELQATPRAILILRIVLFGTAGADHAGIMLH